MFRSITIIAGEKTSGNTINRVILNQFSTIWREGDSLLKVRRVQKQQKYPIMYPIVLLQIVPNEKALNLASFFLETSLDITMHNAFCDRHLKKKRALSLHQDSTSMHADTFAYKNLRVGKDKVYFNICYFFPVNMDQSELHLVLHLYTCCDQLLNLVSHPCMCMPNPINDPLPRAGW